MWLSIVALAFVLRVVGIDVSSHHPDEGNIIKWVREMLTSGSLEPRKMSYGTLTLYLEAAFLWVAEAVRGLFGFHGPLVGRRGVTVARTVSLASSVATVALVPGLFRAAFGDRLSSSGSPAVLAAPLGALFLAVAFLSVQCAHYCTVDSLMALLTTATVLFALQTYRSMRARDAIVCGVCAGLAAGTKYTGALALAPLALGALLCPSRPLDTGEVASGPRGSIPGGTRVHALALAALGAVASVPAFLVAMPYAALQPGRLIEALRYEGHHYATGNTTQFAAGPNTFGWNLEFLYYTGLGPGLSLMALFGLAWVVARVVRPGPPGEGGPERRCRELLLITYPVVVMVFLARYVVRFDRNLLPVLPFAAVLAGVYAQATWEAVSRARRRWLVRVGQGAWVAAVALSVLYPLSRDIVFDWQILKPHTRRQLKQWIREQPEGTKVKKHGFRQQSLSWLQKHGYDYAVMSSHSWEPVAAQPERFSKLVKRYRELFATCKTVAVFRNPWFDSDFFAPHDLLNSATVNIYHGPTLMVLELPPKGGERAGARRDAGGHEAGKDRGESPPGAGSSGGGVHDRDERSGRE